MSLYHKSLMVGVSREVSQIMSFSHAFGGNPPIRGGGAQRPGVLQRGQHALTHVPPTTCEPTLQEFQIVF